jgi:hypothetical protein
MNNCRRTRWTRSTIYLTSNRVDNYLRAPIRADYVAHIDFAALQPVSESPLRESKILAAG